MAGCVLEGRALEKVMSIGQTTRRSTRCTRACATPPARGRARRGGWASMPSSKRRVTTTFTCPRARSTAAWGAYFLTTSRRWTWSRPATGRGRACGGPRPSRRRWRARSCRATCRVRWRVCVVGWLCWLTCLFFPTNYLAVVRRRRDQTFTEEQRQWMHLRRGRYLEFNRKLW